MTNLNKARKELELQWKVTQIFIQIPNHGYSREVSCACYSGIDDLIPRNVGVH